MNRPLKYLGSVLLTLLLAFALTAVALLSVVQFRALDADTCKRILAEKNLSVRVLENLNSYYNEQANTSGIPASIYMESITVEQLEGIIDDSIDNAFGYLKGAQETVAVEADFTLLEKNLTAFFKQYAEENGYQQDEAFDQTLQKAIDAAKTNILTTADVFRFSTLHEAKVLSKLRPYVPWVSRGLWLFVAAAVILLVLLAVVHRKELLQLMYWGATAVCTASVLMTLPAAVIYFSRWFDRFALKSDQIFTAVTSYLYGLTGTVIVIGCIGIGIAAALWIAFALLWHKRSA